MQHSLPGGLQRPYPSWSSTGNRASFAWRTESRGAQRAGLVRRPVGLIFNCRGACGNPYTARTTASGRGSTCSHRARLSSEAGGRIGTHTQSCSASPLNLSRNLAGLFLITWMQMVVSDQPTLLSRRLGAIAHQVLGRARLGWEQIVPPFAYGGLMTRL